MVTWLAQRTTTLNTALSLHHHHSHTSLPLHRSHSPCCHGRVICFSVYAGPTVHWGQQQEEAEQGAPLRTMLWVDTWLDGDEARAGEAAAIIETFRPFWESEQLKKVGGWAGRLPDVAAVLDRSAPRCVVGQ